MSALLDVQITQACNCKSITFKELTGAYDANDNTTGWGTPNEETSAATAATLSIVLPNTTTPVVIDLLDEFFPTTDTCSGYEISGAMVSGVGLNNNFPSGLYSFTYTVTTATVTYTETKQVYFWCTLQCCVDKLFANIDYSNCDCSHNQFEEALTALGYLRGIASFISAGNYIQADKLKAKLEKLCANSKYCKDC